VVLLCVVCVLVTIVAFGHWELDEGKDLPVAARFTDNHDSTVTDKMTGLIWLKNANCFGSLTWDEAMTAAAGLADGHCGLTDGSAAGDWRLPERAELLTLMGGLYHAYRTWSHTLGTHPRMGRPSFSGVQASPYWSATTDENFPDTAWLVFSSMYYGRVDHERKTRPHHVWPVRGEQ
jgi:hypothetical protein